MTQSTKKKIERFYVEEAAKLIGKNWVFEKDQEHPDFLISDNGQKFGLEVRELFTGHHNKSGSVMKQGESHTQKIIDQIRRQYEASINIPLIVKFIGNVNNETLQQALLLIIAEKFDDKPFLHQTILDTRKGLRISVTRVDSRGEWYNVSDKAGCVNQDPIPYIVTAIEEKAKELPRYIETSGQDIRLLLIANRRNNSGKLMLPERTALDTRGFEAVYFFSYPHSVTTFDKGI